MAPSGHLRIDRRLFTFFLGSVAAFMIGASAAGDIARYGAGHDHLMGFIPTFNLNEERNVSTYYSTFLLLVASFFLALIASLVRSVGERSLEWSVLAIGFLFLALDEASGFHELMNDPVRSLLGERYTGIFHFAWVLPGMLMLLPVALFLRRFLFSLAAPVRRRMVLAAVVFIAGAIGVEIYGGWLAGTMGVANLTYAMAYTFEEGMEMFGTVIFIGALLRYLELHFPNFELSVRAGETSGM